MSVAYRPKPAHNNFRVQPGPDGVLEKVCTKRKYPDEREAIAALKKLRHIGMKDCYHCQHCTAWHLSSQRNRSFLSRLPRLPQEEWFVVVAIRSQLIRLGIREPLQ